MNNNNKKPNFLSRIPLTSILILGGTLFVSPWGASSYAADPGVPGVQGGQVAQAGPVSQAPTATFQGTAIEINASAPKPDPDPYALPPHAPESLVKLRGDLQKTYDAQKALVNQMLSYLATSDFDVKSPSIPASASPSEGGPAYMGNYGEILARLEQLNSVIQMTEAEFIHEKEVYLAQGNSAAIQTASAHGTESSSVSFVQGK